jgi:hypothetical protein
MAVRRRAYPFTYGAELTLRLLQQAGLTGTPAGCAETRWLFAYKASTWRRRFFGQSRSEANIGKESARYAGQNTQNGTRSAGRCA